MAVKILFRQRVELRGSNLDSLTVRNNIDIINYSYARMAELVDARDLKSLGA